MNIEVEIKVQIKDFEKAKSTLHKNAVFKRKVRQVDTYYVPAHKNFFANVPVVEFLRIREENDGASFDYHLVINHKQKCEHNGEYETKISDSKKLKAILKRLNFEEKMILDKEREYWGYEDFEIALDKVKDLGSFIEVEVRNSTKDLEITKEDCIDVLARLQISFERKIVVSYPQLMMKKL